MITITDPSYGACSYDYNLDNTSKFSNCNSNLLIQVLLTVVVVLKLQWFWSDVFFLFYEL
ncbi:unnamed protein product [Arabis nemorensis]|uniref:Transmembrane protein n=1 Tax=Arabis nemorensis TaxID=586526 RepID=A0A565CWE1_9BRAS|nr:unnamed protein product [Arabis nemorensis]